MPVNNLDCKMIFDNAPFTMVYLDKQMRVVEINRAMAQTLDLSFEEIKGRYCYEIWGQYSAEKKQQICDNCGAEKALADGKTHIYERQRGGRFYEVTSFPVWNQAEQIVGAVEMSSDITPRKQSDKALEISNLILRTQQNLSPDGILQVDSDGKIVSCNQRFVEMWEIPSELLSVKSDARCVDWVLGKLDDTNHFKQRIDSIYESRVNESFDEIRLKNGKIFERYSSAIFDSTASYHGRVWYFRDITQRLLDENLFAEIKARYNHLFNNLGDAAFLIDVKTLLFLEVNDVGVDRLGYSRDELLAMTPFQVNVTEQGGFIQDCFEQAAEKGFYTHESIHLTKSGEKIPVEIRARYLEIDGRGTILALARDITARKEVEEKLRRYGEKMRDMAMRINEVEEIERRRLAIELHDEVGQSLTALGINLQIMQHSIDMEAFPDHYLRLQDSVELVKEISVKTRDLMADLRPSVLDDFGLVAGLRSYSEQVASRTGIQVSIREALLPPLPENLQNTLFRVVKEAMSNAAQHGQPKTVIVTFQVRGSVCRVVVEDDGVGFLVEKVLDAGNGQHWGLITMQERIASLGGKLEISSGLGEGTTLTIEVNL